MIVLHLRARDVTAIVAQGYDTIRVFRDPSAVGPFNTHVGDVYPLVPNQEFYDFVDNTGNLTDYYEFTYYKSSNLQESQRSTPFTPSPIVGPLGLLTIDYVWASTDIPGVANLAASKVGELIVRAETELLNYANRFGNGLNQSAAGWSITMPIVARMLLEEIYLRNRPAARARAASNLASEKIGSYSYSTRAPATDATYWTSEITNLLQPYLLGRRLDTSVKTTQVFAELNPSESPISHQQDGVAVSRWNDYLDSDLTYRRIYANLVGPIDVTTISGVWSD